MNALPPPPVAGTTVGTVTESRDGGEGAITLGPFVEDEPLDEQAIKPTPMKVMASKPAKRCRVLIGITFSVSIEMADYCRTFDAFAAAIKWSTSSLRIAPALAALFVASVNLATNAS